MRHDCIIDNLCWFQVVRTAPASSWWLITTSDCVHRVRRTIDPPIGRPSWTGPSGLPWAQSSAVRGNIRHTEPQLEIRREDYYY